MLELQKVDPNYVYSLNAFVSIFVRALKIAPKFEGAGKFGGGAKVLNAARAVGAKGLASIAARAGGKSTKAGKKSLLGRFRAAVGKVICANRFRWNVDQLRESRVPQTHLNGDPGDGSLESRPSGNIGERLRQIDDDSKKAIQDRCTDLLQRISLSCFQYLHRSVFREHKLMLATLFTLKSLVQGGSVSNELVYALLNMGSTGVVDNQPLQRQESGSKRPGDAKPPMHLEEWMTPSSWGKVTRLQRVFELQRLSADIAGDADLWADWFHVGKPEDEPLPAPYETMGLASVERLAITRALRPDRLPALLRKFVSLRMGSQYVSEAYHQLEDVLATSSSSTPICFFVTPGADPLKTVEEVAALQNYTVAAGSFVNISMGQGQEVGAEQALRYCAKQGFWVALQNVHLMQEWHGTLEKVLESLVSQCHSNFRCFLTVERLPSDRRDVTLLPEGLLQSCTKVTCGVVSGLQANLKRAWARVDRSVYAAAESRCLPRSLCAMRACLGALCFYHAVVVSRGRFGSSGWSDVFYDFNESDLDISMAVVYNYIAGIPGRKAPSAVPWEQLRFVIGDIMYGGHMTDRWDRRLNAALLEGMMNDGIVEGFEVLPGIHIPAAKGGLGIFEKVINSVYPGAPTSDARNYESGKGAVARDAAAPDDDVNNSPPVPLSSERAHLQWESPELYGLHSNAELLSLQDQEESLFRFASALLSRSLLEPADNAGGLLTDDAQAEEDDDSDDDEQGLFDTHRSSQLTDDDDDGDGEEDHHEASMPAVPGGSQLSREDVDLVRAAVVRMTNRLPALLEVNSKDPALLREQDNPERAPYVSLMLQECKRMNALLKTIIATLGQLKLALSGRLAMSDELHAANSDILVNRVPTEFRAWASTKTLGPWFEELLARHEQLKMWLSELERPLSIWLPGLFNPAALLVAMVQVASQKMQVPLNELTIETHFTHFSDAQQALAATADVRDSEGGGVLFHGLNLEGCRWTTVKEITNTYVATCS